MTVREYRAKYELDMEQAAELRNQLRLFRDELQTEAYLGKMLTTDREKLTTAWIASEFGICEMFAEWLHDLYFAITEHKEQK